MSTAELSTNTTSHQVTALAGWLAWCFAPTLTAALVSMDGWFGSLNKPVWNPSGWFLGPVWTILYSAMAVAAWLIWREGGWLEHG